MNDENTNTPNEDGNQNNNVSENNNENVSEYDKALALVERREAATKAENEVLTRKEKLASNELLSGSGGGNVPIKMVSPEDKKIIEAAKYFEGTSLEKAITENA